MFRPGTYDQASEYGKLERKSTKYKVRIDPFISLTYDKRKAVQQLGTMAANFVFRGLLIIHKFLNILMINFGYMNNTVNKHMVV